MENSNELFVERSLKSEDQAAHWFSSLNLSNIQVLYIYGVNSGFSYAAAANWLKDDAFRSLVYLEEDPQVIIKLPKTHMGQRLLQDPQVAVHVLDDLLELDKIVLPYSVFSFSVCCENILDQQNKERFSEIKSLIAFFSDYHRSATLGYAQGGLFFYNNYFRNLLKLPFSYHADLLESKFKNIPAIICGAGPSLDKNIEVLRKLHSRALIFAGATAINALNAKDVIPHVGVGIDPNPQQLTRLIMNRGYEMPFFYRNRINHKALELIHGDKIYVSGSTGFKIAGWIEEKLGIKASKNEKSLPEGYNVLNFALSLANFMGCNPIIMVGVDLAYSEGHSYSSGINSHPLHDRKKDFQTKSEKEQLLNKKDINGNPIRTLWKWVRESLWYGIFAHDHPDVLLINATEGGIGFPDIQNKTLAEVAAKHLVQHYDIPTQLHGEIQNSQWPKKIKESQIITLLNKLSESLKRCEKICQHIEDGLSLPYEKRNDNSNSIELSKLYDSMNELREEDAFQAILQDIDESCLRFTSLERQRLKNEKKLIPQEEVMSRQNTLDLIQYGLLKKTAHSNAGLIDSILSNYEATKVTLPTSSKNSSPAEKISSSEGDVYIFDGQYLTLRDCDLELNYTEEFPVEFYLRKERRFYPDGKVKLEQFYQGMMLHGPSTFFANDGKVLALSWFVHGQQQGKMHTYFSSGQVHSVQRFKRGQKHGKQEFFYPDGSLKTILLYREGRLHAENQPACSLYYSNGQLARQQFFIEGMLEGVERMWKENGQLEMEAHYKHNNPFGVTRQWHPNGQLACEINFDNNSQRVSAHYWTSEGISVSADEIKPESYFEILSKNAGSLSHSLENVFSKMTALMPSVLDSTPKLENNDALQPDFAQDLKDLQNELARLEGLSQALKRETAKENSQECGLDPKTQASFEQQLLLKHRKMTDQMQSIDQGLHNMLKELLQNNEDDQNEK